MVSRRVHPAHGPGGLERHVFDLVSQLARRGVQIDLFAETPASDTRRLIAERAFGEGITPHWVAARRLPIGRRKGTIVVDRITNYPVWSRRVATVVEEAAAAVSWTAIHVHGLAGWGLARARSRVSAPLVVTTHGLEEFRSQGRLKHWAYAPFRAGMRTVAKRSDAVIATDESLTALVERYLRVPAAAQVVISNAVDPAGCRTRADRERGRELLRGLGLNQADPLFLSVGRVDANKGLTTLVAALDRAASRLPRRWGWVLVGRGPESDRVRRAVADAGLTDRVGLAGRLDDDDLHSLYAVSTWFVHPTLYEGSSLVTLEAMAHARPVVASRAGGLPDKVVDGETGYLVPPGDVAALAAALIRAAESDGAALGAEGQRLCQERFSWDAVIPQYVALYERMQTAASDATGRR